MDRLLVVRLEAQACVAEVVFNGIPVARVDSTQAVAVVPVHQFAVAGANRITLVIGPALPGTPQDAEPQLSDGHTWAGVRLLLPRIGQLAHPANARTLAQIDWAAPDHDLYETPLLLDHSVELPIAFPRWRWLDAPVIEDVAAVGTQAVPFLQRLAIDLARCEPDSFVVAARLRFEELCLAYQRNPTEEIGRWRAQVGALRSALPLKPSLPSRANLCLRPVAEGRLIECLTSAGQPALTATAPDGRRWHWPVRVAFIEGQLHVLR
jgi:hypothetical protein